MKKLIIIYLSIFTLVSCNDWLAITPKGEVEADDLLKDEKGYNYALAGVYYTLSESSLYGKELTYGMMDLIGGYWYTGFHSSHVYKDFAAYDYSTSFSKDMINNIWHQFYVAISGCNRILESLEHNRNSISQAELIEAETLGLRAFCHQELFRLFGPIIQTSSDLDKATIAYREKFDNIAIEFESGRSILTKVKRDLTDALALAKDDPIKIIGRRGDANPSVLNHNDVLAHRGGRMNYFAILGLLARNEQLLLNQDGAFQYADRIITELEQYPVLTFVSTQNFEGIPSYRITNCATEMLFALHNENMYDQLIYPLFCMEGNGLSYSTFPIDATLYNSLRDNVYAADGSGTDNRLRYWFDPSTTYYNFNKLRKGDVISNMFDAEIPIMKLTEVYYIACEAMIGKDNAKALDYLNVVREVRNIYPLVGSYNDQEMLGFLIREMRKEYIGDGRLFPTLKRLNMPIYNIRSGTSIELTKEMAVFPIPDDEYEYSPNEKPV